MVENQGLDVDFGDDIGTCMPRVLLRSLEPLVKTV